jgi:HEAT repeat protein
LGHSPAPSNKAGSARERRTKNRIFKVDFLAGQRKQGQLRMFFVRGAQEVTPWRMPAVTNRTRPKRPLAPGRDGGYLLICPRIGLLVEENVMPSRYVGMIVLLLSLAAQSSANDEPTKVGGKTLKQWITDLKNSDPSLRETAVRAIGQFGGAAKEAVPDLIARLSDPDYGVQVNAAIALRAVGVANMDKKDVPMAVKGLTQMLGVGGTASLHAAVAIADYGAEARIAVTNLISNTKNTKSWEVRRVAAGALGRVAADPKDGPEPRVVQTLLGLVNSDPCGPVRMESILALGSVGPIRQDLLRSVNDVMAKVIRDDKDDAVKVWAHVMKANLNPSDKPASVSFAVSKLDKGEPNVRAQAARALGILGAKEQLGRLVEALTDLEGASSNAAAVLVGLKDDLTAAHVADVAKLLDDKDRNVQIQAVNVLSSLGAKAKPHIPALAKLAESKDYDLVELVVRGLGQLGKDAAAAVPELTRIKDHEDPVIKQAVAEALARIGGK